MQRKLLEKMCCPFDKKELHINVFNEDENNEIHEGILTCTECDRYFPIIQSIPIMSPDEYRQKELELPVLERWGLMLNEQTNSFILDEQSKTKLLV